jgi:hypothetical protein
MMLLRRKLQLVLLAAVLAALLAASPAGASSAQQTYFESPNLLLNPVTRPATLAKLQRLGVKALRIELSWHAVAPAANSTHRPAFDATNPAAYNWALYDPLIEEAQRRGWQVLMTVTSPVPRWAEASPRPRSLLYRPNAAEFGRFMTAVGRHYGGEVQLFSIWNEPNHHEFLEPQFNRNGSPASPQLYRALYQAGYAGLRASGIPSPKVLIGETAPEGETRPGVPVLGPRHNMAPLAFLRGVLCLSASYHRAGSCGLLPASGWGLHPYRSGASPYLVPTNPETVSIGSLSRMTRALDAAARAGALPSHLPLYITEFGVMSRPNPYQGVPVAQQAEYDAMAEQIAYRNPRVASFSQYLLKDDPMRRRSVGFQTGLEYYSGRAKPSLAAFPVPMTVTRNGSRYALWGLVRPAGEATSAAIEVRHSGSSRFVPLAEVHTDALGYWTLSSSVAGAAWRARWTSPSGTRYTGPPIRAYRPGAR